MTALVSPIAIPFAHQDEPMSCSPLSRSPFLVRSPVRHTPVEFALAKAALPIPRACLPPTPPTVHAHAQAQEIVTVPYPSKATRPTPIVPPPAPPPAIHSGSIIEAFRVVLDDINLDECEAHGENAVFVCDLAEVYRQALRWKRELGHRVEAFFGASPDLASPRVANANLSSTAAVKCNPDPHVLQLLASMGLGFDCASQPEISAVLSLAHTVDPSRIIYANPCKAPSFIRHAAKNGVNYMTFDNSDELAKVKKYHPHAKMVLRILTDDSGSLCRLGLKFGAPLSEVRALLRKAKALGIEVTGVSFHCGSGCTNPDLFGDAVKRAKWAFDVGKEEGFTFTLLDIGGGFEDDNFELIAAILRPAIEQYFPVAEGIRVIAEPGRYFVSKAFELATNIIARRAARESEHDDDETAAAGDLAMVDVPEAAEEEEPVVMCTRSCLSVAWRKVLTSSNVQTTSTTVSTARSTRSCSTTRSSSHTCSPFRTSSTSRTTRSPRTCPGRRARSGVPPACVAASPRFAVADIRIDHQDSIDCVQANAKLPVSLLRVGDWLRWEKMGAYTICAASQVSFFGQVSFPSVES